MASAQSIPPQAQLLLRRQAEVQSQLKAQLALRDNYFWLTECTRTEDNQPLEGQDPYRPFPKRNYMRPLLRLLDREPMLAIEKSRTMMASWLVAGWCAHYAFNRPATTVLFQSQDEDRAVNLVNYVKILWSQSLPPLKKAWPVKSAPDKQAYNEFVLANGSHFYGVVGDPNKVRSLHPTIYIADESAFMDRFEEAWSVAAGTRVPKMIALSSVQPGAYYSFCNDGTQWVDWPEDAVA